MASRKEQLEVLREHMEVLKENTESNRDLMSALRFFGNHLRTLASETGAWRKEDNDNHSNEAKQRSEAIRLLRELADEVKKFSKALELS